MVLHSDKPNCLNLSFYWLGVKYKLVREIVCSGGEKHGLEQAVLGGLPAQLFATHGDR